MRETFIAGCLFVVLFFVVYVGGYFGLDQGDWLPYGKGCTIRTYPSKWMAMGYKPVAYLEGRFTGRTIYTSRSFKED